MLDMPASATLADLRADIDRIDAALHELLIQRGEIIDRLIAVKGGAGSAFRPEREAEMMRHIVSRHRGILPLDTVESVWRIIISTFTYVQANYSVHTDVSGGDAAMRDCCRFHFGFTVPYVPHQSSASVISAVAAAKGDLGLVAVSGGANWGKELLPPSAPKIIARLPFVERTDHPAGLPLFVIAKPLSEAASRDVVLYAVTANAPPHAAETGALAADGIDIVDDAKAAGEISLLVAAPGALDEAGLRAALSKAGVATEAIGEIGSHAARFDLALKSAPTSGAAR
jgi:chorismate mutase